MGRPSRTGLALLLLPLCAGCGGSVHEPSEPVTAPIVIDAEPAELRLDPLSLDAAMIDGHDLVLALHYTGGCRTHRFALHLGPAVPPGDVPALDLSLSHDAAADPCEAVRTLVLRLDLGPVDQVIAPRAAALLRIYRPGAAAPSFELPYTR